MLAIKCAVRSLSTTKIQLGNILHLAKVCTSRLLLELEVNGTSYLSERGCMNR
jgi:hypothetical protein